MAFKITMVFQIATGAQDTAYNRAKHLGSWTESFYSTESDATLVRNQLELPLPLGTNLLPNRAYMLPRTASIIGYRMQTVSINAHGIVVPNGRAQILKKAFPGPPLRTTDVPQMSLNVSAAAVGVVNIRHFTLRGIPDDQVVDGEFQPTPGYKAGVDAYAASLAGWAFKAQDQTPAFTPINSITSGGLVTFPAAVPWAVDDWLQIKGAKTAFGDDVHGKFRIGNLLPLTFQVQLVGYNHEATIGGGARKYTEFLPTMAAFQIDRISTRKVGRPFDSYRGRASKTLAS